MGDKETMRGMVLGCTVDLACCGGEKAEEQKGVATVYSKRVAETHGAKSAVVAFCMRLRS